MSELAVGSLKGLAANSFVIDVASGSKIVQPGAILQVVQGTLTSVFSASVAVGASATLTGLTATITPTSTTSKVLVMVNLTAGAVANFGQGQFYTLTRGGTDIFVGNAASNRQQRTGATNAGAGISQQMAAITFLDSPSSVSALTYGVDIGHAESTTQTVYINRGFDDTDATRNARTSSSITLMEVAG
jgi:hypothetical protein